VVRGAGGNPIWRLGRQLEMLLVDQRLQESEVKDQEILTRDRLSLRLDASVQYEIKDPARAVVDTPNVSSLVYRSLQFALRHTIATVSLDDLLSDRTRFVETIGELVRVEMESFGVVVVTAGITDIILPGEMKTILNQVVEAEKTAQANAVRRRDESANIRALANTAKMLESNATMVRLKELESLETIAGNIQCLNVYDGLDGVAIAIAGRIRKNYLWLAVGVGWPRSSSQRMCWSRSHSQLNSRNNGTEQ